MAWLERRPAGFWTEYAKLVFFGRTYHFPFLSVTLLFLYLYLAGSLRALILEGVLCVKHDDGRESL